MPVETEVFDTLCIVFIKADCVGFENEIQHNQQANEDVQSVRTRSDVEDGALNGSDIEALCNQMAPLNKFEDDKQRTEQESCN